MTRSSYQLQLNRGGMTLSFSAAGKRCTFRFSDRERQLWAASFWPATPAKAAEIVEQIFSERLIVWPWLRWRLAFVRAALNTEAMGNLGYEAEEAEASSERRDPWSG